MQQSSFCLYRRKHIIYKPRHNSRLNARANGRLNARLNALLNAYVPFSVKKLELSLN